MSEYFNINYKRRQIIRNQIDRRDIYSFENSVQKPIINSMFAVESI